MTLAHNILGNVRVISGVQKYKDEDGFHGKYGLQFE